MNHENNFKLRVVYSPIHGSGLLPVKKLFQKLPFVTPFFVEEQCIPDGNFSTVQSPNPENPQSLQKVMEYMDKENIHIGLASDPDADRIGLVLKEKGVFKFLSGNELGVLMLYYVGKFYTQKGILSKRPFVVKSIVTTPLINKVAHYFGIDVLETLTGFKWLCAEMDQQFSKGRVIQDFILATEESFGFLITPLLRDKDGIIPMALILEMIYFYENIERKGLFDVLEEIYHQFGHHLEKNITIDFFEASGTQKVKKLYQLFKNVESIPFQKLKVDKVVDYAVSFKELGLPSSEVLRLDFKDYVGSLFIRGSGTEPKLKFYVHLESSREQNMMFFSDIQQAIQAVSQC